MGPRLVPAPQAPAFPSWIRRSQWTFQAVHLGQWQRQQLQLALGLPGQHLYPLMMTVCPDTERQLQVMSMNVEKSPIPRFQSAFFNGLLFQATLPYTTTWALPVGTLAPPTPPRTGKTQLRQRRPIRQLALATPPQRLTPHRLPVHQGAAAAAATASMMPWDQPMARSRQG